MKKAVLSTKYFLVEGGCNACKYKNTETTTIHFEDHSSQALDSLDTPSLVKVIAQKNGWRETIITEGLNDDKVVLKKGTTIIEPQCLKDKTVYKKQNETLEVATSCSEKKELFEQVNQILADLFGIEPYKILLVEE